MQQNPRSVYTCFVQQSNLIISSLARKSRLVFAYKPCRKTIRIWLCNPKHSHSFYTVNSLIEYSVRVNIRYGIIRNQLSNYNTISLFHSPLQLKWYFSYFRHEIFRRNVIRAITLCGTAAVEDCSLNVSRLKTNPQPT